MKRLMFAAFFLFAFSSFLSAGDAAAFSDIGFSADGKTYIFGEYGKTDKSFQAYAEIYVVDVARNDFVPGGVFKSGPSSATTEISGRKAYDALLRSSSSTISTYRCTPASPANLLYIRNSAGKIAKPEPGSSTDRIVFQDFERSTDDCDVFFKIQMKQTVKGKGRDVSSSYYIDMRMEDQDGKLLGSWKVGNPGYERKGVSSYEIERIFTDPTGKSLVFLIQKTVQDDSGTSIRYMVETLRM
ncbi:MAG: DUF2259 domain-containing protein [Treponema sp.]|nr:DUF2259 domain-containing protein [Treponema sp.]